MGTFDVHSEKYIGKGKIYNYLCQTLFKYFDLHFELGIFFFEVVLFRFFLIGFVRRVRDRVSVFDDESNGFFTLFGGIVSCNRFLGHGLVSFLKL